MARKSGAYANRTARMERSSAGEGILMTCGLLSAAGLLLALYLGVLHWKVHNEPGHISFCAISEAMNCDTVAISPYSMVMGVPVAHWGGLFFVGMIILFFWGYVRAESPWPWGLAALGNMLGLVVATLLTLVSKVVIQSLCIMCLLVWLTTLLMGLLGIAGHRKIDLNPWTTALLLFAGVLGGALAFVGLFPEAALKSGWWWAGSGVSLIGLGLCFSQGSQSGFGALAEVLRKDVAYLLESRPRAAGLALLALGLVSGLVWGSPRLYPKQQDSIASGIRDIDVGHTESGHNWIGAAQPKVTITEYSDYECPFCRKAHEIVREVVRERKDWLRLVHIHIPLDNRCNPLVERPFHKHACDCARAAICADRQGAFWPMNDALFLRQGGLDAGGLTTLAVRLGLDAEKFRSCIKSEESAALLSADLRECRTLAEECDKLGRGFGTPIFRVENQVYVGMQDKDWWVRVVEEEKAASASAPLPSSAAAPPAQK